MLASFRPVRRGRCGLGAEADLEVGCKGAPASRARIAAASAPHVSLEDPRLVGEHDCLDAVAEVELLEDVGDVRLDRRLADVELLRDLPVREAAGDQARDISFALTEVIEFLRRRGTGRAGELLDHPSRDW